MKRTAILLQGPPGVGKDTVGEILVRNHGFTRYAFADKVRQFAEAINPSILIYDVAAGWHNPVMRDIDENPPAGDLVFTDARFPNELSAVRLHPRIERVFVLNITRPGFERVNDHVSENYQLMADTNSPWLNNNGTLASLEETLRYYISNRRFHNADGKSQEWEAFHVRSHA